MIDLDDDLVRRARNNRWLVRVTLAAIAFLLAANIAYLMERL